MSTIPDEDLSTLLDEAASSYDVPSHGPDEILAAVAAEPARPAVLHRRWVQLSAAAAVVAAGLAFGVSRYDGDGPSTRMTAAADAGSANGGGRADAPLAGDGFAPAAESNQSTTRSYTSLDSVKTAQAPAASLPAPAVARLSAVAGTTGVASGSAPGAAPPIVSAPAPDEGEARVVKTGSIALVVKDGRVSPTLTATERAAKANGGYISAGTTDEYGETPSGELTIRVPVTKFETLVAQIRGLDAKVRTASTSGKDITAQYSDLEAQLRSLKATRERFYDILAKTRTISEILTVQQRIDNVTGQIDRIEGQRKLLASQSALSTLTVSVSEEGDPIVRAEKPRSGLSQAFHDAWDGFVTGVEAIIRHSGRALLLLLCLVVALAIGRSGWRVARRRMV
jgi:hypothetical protein